ncbi:hypothetical protein HMSSN036_66790 [Paenibacillus macerans]|nr:hypothetical protein HMSSN036_66790 [Paenibacillus macerans]
MLAYDDHYNLTRMTLPDGTSAEWSYNHRGECLQRRARWAQISILPTMLWDGWSATAGWQRDQAAL